MNNEFYRAFDDEADALKHKLSDLSDQKITMPSPVPFKDKERLLRQLEFEAEQRARSYTMMFNPKFISAVYVVIDEHALVVGVFTELERAEKCKAQHPGTNIVQRFLNE